MPAPGLTLTVGEPEHGASDDAAGAEADEPAESSDGDASMGLAVAALVVGGLGLLAGAGGWVAGRRKNG